MAKKSKNKNSAAKFLPAIAALFGVVAIVMFFLPAVVAKENAESSYNFFKIAFGYKETSEGIINVTVTHLNFSFMNLLTVLFVVGGTVLTVCNYLGKGKNNLFGFVAAICFVAAGVFFLLAVGFTSFNEDLTTIIGKLGGDIKEYYKLGIGSIIGAIVSFLAAVSAAAPAFLK